MVLDKSSDKPPTDYFKFGKAMLRIWGLWPSKNFSPKIKILYKIYGIIIISSTLIPYILCFLVDTAIQFYIGQWMDMLPRFSVALAMVLGFVKLCIYVFYKSTIENFMAIYEEKTFVTTSFFRPNEIIARCVFLYNIQVAVCFGLCLILVMTDIETYLKETIDYLGNSTVPALPFVNWLPFDFTKTPGYEISYFLTNFWFFVSAYIIFVYDTICMGLMIHTGGQLKILRKAMETLWPRALYELEEDGVKATEAVIAEKIRSMFKKCAKHHQGIIRQNYEFQGIYSTMVFFQFFISCLMVCFTILIVTNMNSPLSSRITSSVILLCTMWELSVYCYFGNEIIYQSNCLSKSIFLSNWVDGDSTLKSSIMIMMIRAKIPLVFTAGRFVPLSLETFLTVLKASYSYYAFLNNVANE